MSTLSDIDRLKIEDLTDELFFNKYVMCNNPLVILDGALHWRAIKRWSPVFFKYLLGSKKVIIKSSESGIFDYNKIMVSSEVGSHEVPFPEAIDLICKSDSTKYYIQQTSVQSISQELMADISIPEIITSHQGGCSCNMWFGAQGCKTPLHHDLSENLLSQIKGRKRVILFPPREEKHLYPAIGYKLPHCSQVDVFSPDIVKYPLFTKASVHRQEFVLEPGNILYIPSNWWHALESLDISMSVNIWWQIQTSLVS